MTNDDPYILLNFLSPISGEDEYQNPGHSSCAKTAEKAISPGRRRTQSATTSPVKAKPSSMRKNSNRGDVLAQRLRRNLVKKNIPNQLQQTWDKSNKNTVKYKRTKEMTFKRMLGLLAKHGGPKLAELATKTVVDGYGEEVPLLIDVLRDCKDRKSFMIIIDECMKFFIEFAKQENGEQYSTGSMRIMVRRIFAYLKMKYDIIIAESDFSTNGSFRSCLSDIWTAEREKNPEFGRQKPKSEICLEDVKYVYDAIKEGVLCPENNAYHLKLVVSFILLRHFALRSAEASLLNISDVRWKKYDFGPDRGTKYVELFVDITKVNRLKLGNWRTPPNYGKLKVRDNPDDPVFNAYALIQLYMSKLGKKPKGQ